MPWERDRLIYAGLLVLLDLGFTLLMSQVTKQPPFWLGAGLRPVIIAPLATLFFGPTQRMDFAILRGASSYGIAMVAYEMAWIAIHAATRQGYRFPAEYLAPMAFSAFLVGSVLGGIAAVLAHLLRAKPPARSPRRSFPH
jgi:hypothetical protein